MFAVLGLALTVLAVGAVAVAPAGAEEVGEDPTSRGSATSTSVSPTETPSDVPSEMPSEPASETTPPGDSVIEITDATFRWGVNHEANTAAYNPGTYNFFSAGKLPDPGRANQLVPRGDWKQRSGNVSVEKWNARSSQWARATWQGLRTDTTGSPLIVGGDSQHHLVFAGGTGELDPDAATAHVEWQGSATVVFYSGYSFFYLSDPVLDVAGGRGTVSALVSGFAATRDGSGWQLLPEQRLVVARLSAKSLLDKDGFTVAPDYAKVAVEVTEAAQKRDEVGWGAFPQQFVTYMERLGIGSFWYSSGGAADARKSPLPVTVAYEPGSVDVPTPTASPTEVPTVENTAPTAPSPTAPVPRMPVPAILDPPLPPADVVGDNVVLTAARPVTPELRLVGASAEPATESPSRAWMWLSGTALLLLTAALTLVPLSPRRN